MDAKINIAEILKDKPKGTKLYSPIFGNLRYEDLVPDLGEYTVVTSDNTSAKHSFRSDSRYNRHGEPLMLLPSKEMHDWSKFAWKKGDLLVNSCGFQCIFKEWASDDYTKFNGCYSNSRDGYEDVSNAETAKFDKLDHNIAYGYIREIERKLGGKLNLETLEIEKQLEFKNGDVLFVKCDKQDFIEIFNYSKKNGDLYDHASLDTAKQNLDISGKYKICEDEIVEIRLATEEEKQQLFSALAKEGKAWDAEKKQVVDLKPKWTPKPFDRVITRNAADDVWTANIFSHMDSHGEYVTIACVGGYTQCLPYNEETAKLIGTTNNWEV